MRIAVIGAGIGGLVAAAGLQRAGHEVRVYERRGEPRVVGAGITLNGNAFAALDDIGLGDVVRAISGPALGGVRSGQRRPTGRWLVSLPPADTSPLRSMHRADLHRSLLGELAPGTVRAGSRVSVMPDGSPGIVVADADMGGADMGGAEATDRAAAGAADGETAGEAVRSSTATHTERFDLVVGADGLRSTARAVWGLDRGVRYAGYTAWRGVTESRGQLADEVGETWGRGRRFGIVKLPDDRVYWFATADCAPGAVFPDERDTVRDLFAGWHEPIAELIDATPRAAVLRHDIYDLAELPDSFVRGRCVLLGDAAHAMTPDLGQGAGQAIEDAATLVLLLSGARSGSAAPIRVAPARLSASAVDIDAALARYSKLRRARTLKLWRASRAMGRVAQSSGAIAARARDAALFAIPDRLASGAAAGRSAWPRP